MSALFYSKWISYGTDHTGDVLVDFHIRWIFYVPFGLTKTVNLLIIEDIYDLLLMLKFSD